MSPLIILLFAALDRLLGWKLGPGVVRLVVTPLIVALACYFVLLAKAPVVWRPSFLSPDLALAFVSFQFGLCFLIERDPKWTVGGGELAPYRRQFWGTVRRHSLALPFALPLLQLGVDPVISLPLLFAYALFAAGLGRLKRMYETSHINEEAEVMRGAVLGLVIFLSSQKLTSIQPIVDGLRIT